MLYLYKYVTLFSFLPGPLTGAAVSAASPLIDTSILGKLESVNLSFDYAFIDGVDEKLKLFLTNTTTGVTTFSTDLASAPKGEIFSTDLASFITTLGAYTLTYELDEKQSTDAAGFNKVVLNIKQAPEPGFTTGLLALGIGAAVTARKRKTIAGTLLKND